MASDRLACCAASQFDAVFENMFTNMDFNVDIVLLCSPARGTASLFIVYAKILFMWMR